jgi:myo-inositol 2-dehydrogenase/D-chiro-inositol 1-dehydrogenase
MGRGFVAAMQQSDFWEVAAICDTSESSRELAAKSAPGAQILSQSDAIFSDKTIDVVGLFTLADARPAQIRQALQANKHVIAEKPLAADVATEWQLVKEIEASDRLVAVNLFNRNAWYHKDMLAFIAEGEIGDLAILRICHMTPGHMPTEGHEPEGPPFHDCGMHYVDVARWYAHSEFEKWHAQGIRMWDHKDPWWVQVHGNFANGVVFDITQGFVYGQLAKQKTHNCYAEAIGTKGVCRMRHNFIDATVEMHGIHATVNKTGLFNDKKLDVMVDIFARSVAAGKNLGMPSARDSVIASEVSWAMLRDAVANGLPVKGAKRDMQQILQHRRTLRSGYGLPSQPQGCPEEAIPAGQPPMACGEELCGLQEIAARAAARESAERKQG